MKRRAPAIGREALAAEIASLSKLDTDELRARWKAMFGNPPSRDISRSFLTRAIAYRLQEKAFGGLKPATQRSYPSIEEAVAQFVLRELDFWAGESG